MRPLRLETRLQWLRPKDARRILQVSRSTMIRWERRGILQVHRTPAGKRPGQRRYRLSDLEAILAKRSLWL